MIQRGFPFIEDGLASETRELIANALLSRKEFLQDVLDPRRNINHECGYPETGDLGPRAYRDMYDRESIATRVVEVLAKESWQVQPTIFEDKDADSKTDFEAAFNQLGRSLRGRSWLNSKQGNPFWEYLMRADVLSGIGSYGVILIGVDDGKDLSEPIDGVEEAVIDPESAPRLQYKLLYIRVFDESMAPISQYESDMEHPRYSQPVMYDITFNDPLETSQGGIGLPTSTRNVHWTRVVHIADNLNSSETFGVPRQRPVWNNLLNLRKMYGGSAEMYWRGAFPGLSFETHPQLGDTVKLKAGFRDEMENYMNGLQRYLSLIGMSAKSLAPQVVDPTPQIDAQITAICIRNGMPKRVFMGTERGELSSTQDEGYWDDRLTFRQNTYLTPRVVSTVLDRFIILGFLPEPTEYGVDWPDLSSPSDEDKADVALKQTEAMAKYVQGDVESIMKLPDYYNRILGLTDEEVEAAMLALEEEEDTTSQASPLLGLVGGVTGMAELFKAAADGAMSEETLKELIKLFYRVDDARADEILAEGIPEPPEPEVIKVPTNGPPQPGNGQPPLPPQ